MAALLVPRTLASPARRSAVELPGREQPHLADYALGHWVGAVIGRGPANVRNE